MLSPPGEFKAAVLRLTTPATWIEFHSISPSGELEEHAQGVTGLAEFRGGSGAPRASPSDGERRPVLFSGSTSPCWE